MAQCRPFVLYPVNLDLIFGIPYGHLCFPGVISEQKGSDIHRMWLKIQTKKSNIFVAMLTFHCFY